MKLARSEGYSTFNNQTAAHAVALAVNDAPDYHDGQIEAMGRKLDKLVEIVGMLANRVYTTERERINFAEELGLYAEKD